MFNIKKLYWKYNHKFFWNVIAPIKWLLFQPSKRDPNTELNFSIGIVTYKARYEKYFQDLIRKLCLIFPDAEIIIMINGYYDEAMQREYLGKITKQLDAYSNVKYFTQEKPTGLSKLWNQIILNSKHESVFILNDDIRITPGFRKDLIHVNKNDVCLINNSWSHFLITKQLVEKNGWFDERLTGVGNEDMDYEFRMIINELPINSVISKNLKNEVELTTDFSYGKTEKVVNKKYSAANWEFFKTKWDVSDNKFDNSIYSGKFNVYFSKKSKLETPDFYSKR